MSEVRRIREQMKRAFEGGAWHGPAVLETLDGLAAARAAARPIAAAHSIWEIVLHLTTWKSVVARRVLGEVVGDVPEEVDWPPVEDQGAAAWKASLAKLHKAHDELERALAEIADDQLDEPPYARASTRYVQLHGAIQHDLYHAGQIAILAKG